MSNVDWDALFKGVRLEDDAVGAIEATLKPCPFCGKIVAIAGTVAELEGFIGDIYHCCFTVVCDFTKGGCGAAIGRQYKSEEEAVEAWNRRANDQKEKKKEKVKLCVTCGSGESFVDRGKVKINCKKRKWSFSPYHYCEDWCEKEDA